MVLTPFQDPRQDSAASPTTAPRPQRPQQTCRLTPSHPAELRSPTIQRPPSEASQPAHRIGGGDAGTGPTHLTSHDNSPVDGLRLGLTLRNRGSRSREQHADGESGRTAEPDVARDQGGVEFLGERDVESIGNGQVAPSVPCR